MFDCPEFPDVPKRGPIRYLADDLIETMKADAANDNQPRQPGDSMALLRALATPAQMA
jgi:hypothetical protein